MRTLADADRVAHHSDLRKTNWVVGGRNGAATRLGVNRTTLIAKMRKLRISREATRQNDDESYSFNEAQQSSFSMLA